MGNLHIAGVKYDTDVVILSDLMIGTKALNLSYVNIVFIISGSQ